jgi:FkbM family methyltransferase
VPQVFISYSEYLEDLFLYDAFNQFSFQKSGGGGFYVDIGANDPVNCSVTKSFYIDGWTGINVEPIPDMHKALEIDRPLDINVCCCISSTSGVVTLYLADGASTVETTTLKNVKKNNALIGEIQSKSLTMNELFEKYLPNKDQTINFLKIDVEGHEIEVLKGLNFNLYCPQVICIESVVPWKGTKISKVYEEILFKNGYTLGFEFRNNNYYKHASFQNIEFIGVEALMQKYRVFIVSQPNDKYRLSYMAIESVFSSYPWLKSKVLNLARYLYPFISKNFPKLIKN